MSAEIADRICARIQVDPLTGCHIWTGGTIKGYGAIRLQNPRRVRRVHLVAYELAHGPVPAGMELDHVCHTGSGCTRTDDCPHRLCANPDHLEPVTHRVNVLRGNSPAARQARRTHCLRGNHPLSGDNLYITSRGGRQCRTCKRESNAAGQRRRRAAARAEPS
jgi:hypothetical protein